MIQWDTQHSRGFTIVELLIVIVVIGILAAIVIVAFNGVQTRANNNKTVTAVAEYGKLLQRYAIANDAYPIVNWACLAEVATPNPRCGNMTDGVNSCGGGAATANPTLDTALKTISAKLPELSTQKMACNGKEYGGAWYHSVDGRTAVIQFYLKGNINPCPSIGSLTSPVRSQNSDTTWCNMTLPAL